VHIIYSCTYSDRSGRITNVEGTILCDYQAAPMLRFHKFEYSCSVVYDVQIIDFSKFFDGPRVIMTYYVLIGLEISLRTMTQVPSSPINATAVVIVMCCSYPSRWFLVKLFWMWSFSYLVTIWHDDFVDFRSQMLKCLKTKYFFRQKWLFKNIVNIV